MASSANTTILRRVYAFDSNTDLPLSTGQTLVTDGLGGTLWISVLSTLTLAGGSVVGNLPSTISSFSSLAYMNTMNFAGLSSMSTDMYKAISSLGYAILTALPAAAAVNSLTSTTASLGSQGYISTSALTSSLTGVSQATYTSSFSTFTSTLNALGNLGFVSTASLTSTVAGLGSLGYISSPIGSVTSQSQLLSTVAGLGTTGYVSTLSLPSTIIGLGTAGYVSTSGLQSTVAGLGTTGYLSTSCVTSTVTGLGSIGYVSTSALVSTTIALSTQKANIRFDITGAVVVNGNNTITFNNVGNIIYISSFLQSSISYTGPPTGVQMTPPLVTPVSMTFSTAQIEFGAFANFMNSTSRVSVDVYPTFAFSKLATGADGPTILPISTMFQYGTTLLTSTCVTSFLYVGNTRVALENGTYADASNMHTTPLKLTFPPSSIVGRTTQPYTLVHVMTSSINNAQYQNALHTNVVTPYFSPTNSVFVSVQNIPTN